MAVRRFGQRLRLIMILAPQALAFRSNRNSVKSGPETFGQLHSVVTGPKVDEERAGLVVEHVIVDGGDLDAVVPQGLDERIGFAGERHEIARDRCLAVAGRLKIDGDCRAIAPRIAIPSCLILSDRGTPN
jgi:hypothetical protein